MKKVLICLVLIFSSFSYADTSGTTSVKVEQGPRCSTVILNNPKTGELISATTTCPGSESTPGSVSKVFPDGKVIVLQNGQIINL